MSDDTKLDFYLKHRRQIEEWAALREGAKQALDDALLTAVTALASSTSSVVEVTAANVRYARWRVPGAEQEPVWIELYWNHGQLLKGTADSAWPYLVLVVSDNADPSYAPTRARIKEATRGTRIPHGLTQEGRGTSPWVWSGTLTPVQEPITIDGYVAYCMQRFQSAWTGLHPVILHAIGE